MKRALLLVSVSMGLILGLGSMGLLVGLGLGSIAAGYAKPMAGPEEAKDKYEVTLDNFSFGPASLTVPAGTTVTWVNRDDVPHNVVSTEKKFSSPVLDTDESFSYTFTDPGTYEYYCSIHPRMTAKVIVEKSEKGKE
jgi:amicyanin